MKEDYIESQFVTYEIALDLKNLGFNEECFGYYKPMKSWMMAGTKLNPEPHFHGCNWPSPDNEMYFMYVANHFGDRTSTVSNSYFTKSIENISVPLWQQVIDWLDSEFGLLIVIIHDKKFGYQWRIITNKNKVVYDCSVTYQRLCDAREIAILKCIELCKKKQ